MEGTRSAHEGGELDTVEVLRDMIIQEFHIEPDKVLPDTDLETLGIDSLSIIEFVFKIEDRFKVILPDRRVEQGQGGKPMRRVWTLRDLATELDALIATQKSESPATGPTP